VYTLRIIGFLDVIQSPEYQILENTTFRKLIVFLSLGEGKETFTKLGPLEEANPIHCIQLCYLFLRHPTMYLSPNLHLKTEAASVSETLHFIVRRIQDDEQN
jgi:hypothetical protein